MIILGTKLLKFPTNHWRGLSASEVAEVRSRIQSGWNKFKGVQGIKLLVFDGGIELPAARPDEEDVVVQFRKRQIPGGGGL